RLTFVAACGTVTAVAASYYEHLPHAQALVRASTVALAIAGLGVVLDDRPFDRLSVLQIVVTSLIAIVGMHVAYAVANHATTIAAILLAIVSAAALWPRVGVVAARAPLASVVLIALLTGHFMFVYVDYGQMPRVAGIPSTVVIMALRIVVSAIAFAA